MVTKAPFTTAGDPLTCHALRRELRRRAVYYAFFEGQGGPLVFMWAAGSAVFAVFLNLLFPVLPWTVLAVVIGWMVVRDCLRDETVRRRLVQSLLQQRFPPEELAGAESRSLVLRGQQLFDEIAQRAMRDEARRGEDLSLDLVVTDAAQMLAMQYESAKQAAEFRRVLAVVGDSARSTGLKPAWSARPENAALREANTVAMQRAAEGASNLVVEVLQQMETLLLQVCQLEMRSIDMVRTSEFGREARESLDRMQAEVDARREVAQKVIQELADQRDPMFAISDQSRKEIDS